MSDQPKTFSAALEKIKISFCFLIIIMFFQDPLALTNQLCYISLYEPDNRFLHSDENRKLVNKLYFKRGSSRIRTQLFGNSVNHYLL